MSALCPMCRPAALFLGRSLWRAQVRLPSEARLDLGPLYLPRCQQATLAHPYHSDKLQRAPEGYHTPLAEPIHLFDFDWGRGPLPALEALLRDGRSTGSQPMVFSGAGTFNAVALLFTLQASSCKGRADPRHSARWPARQPAHHPSMLTELLCDCAPLRVP